MQAPQLPQLAERREIHGALDEGDPERLEAGREPQRGQRTAVAVSPADQVERRERRAGRGHERRVVVPGRRHDFLQRWPAAAQQAAAEAALVRVEREPSQARQRGQRRPVVHAVHVDGDALEPREAAQHGPVVHSGLAQRQVSQMAAPRQQLRQVGLREEHLEALQSVERWKRRRRRRGQRHVAADAHRVQRQLRERGEREHGRQVHHAPHVGQDELLQAGHAPQELEAVELGGAAQLEPAQRRERAQRGARGEGQPREHELVQRRGHAGERVQPRARRSLGGRVERQRAQRREARDPREVVHVQLAQVELRERARQQRQPREHVLRHQARVRLCGRHTPPHAPHERVRVDRRRGLVVLEHDGRGGERGALHGGQQRRELGGALRRGQLPAVGDLHGAQVAAQRHAREHGVHVKRVGRERHDGATQHALAQRRAGRAARDAGQLLQRAEVEAREHGVHRRARRVLVRGRGRVKPSHD